MPTLSIPNTFTANTVAQSAQVNANFNAIATLLNSTKLDSTNLQTSAVATANIAANAVTKAKLATDVVDDSTLALDGTNTLIVKDAGITLAKLAAAVSQALSPTGIISPFAGTLAPTGWLMCDGSAISRTTYSALFTAIGTAYGTGDGSTTFNLPDARGKFLRGLLTLSTVACSGSASGNNVTATGHGYNHSGMKVRVTGSTVSGLSTNTDYYIIYIDANTVAFASSHANAISATKIAISGSAGSMVIQQWEDPDAASREASAPGGNSGQNVGSTQEDTFASHVHGNVPTYNGTQVAGGGSGVQVAEANVQHNTTSTGGNETRPRNMAVNYIIKS